MSAYKNVRHANATYVAGYLSGVHDYHAINSKIRCRVVREFEGDKYKKVVPA
jgi:hypothetical protein